MSHFWLSKSTFLRSIKCQKALYLNKYHKDLRDEISEKQQAVFLQGTSVGELAQQLFKGGIDLTPEEFYDFRKSIARTKALLANDNAVIYEAAFQYDGILCALDILVKENGSIKAYEVKSSTSVKEVYIQDAALQYYVMDKCGYTPEEISIVHINNKYVRKGKLNLNDFFTIQPIMNEVKEFLHEVPEILKQAKNTLQENTIPDIDIGTHCNSPYSCDFSGYCWKHIPEYSVFDIAGMKSNKKFSLYEQGIIDILSIPDEIPLNKKQLLQIENFRNGNTTFISEKIEEFLSSLSYPLHYLDFETFQMAVPLFDSSRPYQQIVFQYSLHIEQRQDQELIHREFLADGNGIDPRKNFIKQLIADVEDKGDILVYNIAFERGRLQELKELYPELSDSIQKIMDRMVDLMTPFQKRHYYSPDLKGSYSIKKVLPSLIPSLDYSKLEIQDGGTAMDTFASMMHGSFQGDIDKTRQDLLDYCKLDTYAMVKIVERLREMVGKAV